MTSAPSPGRSGSAPSWRPIAGLLLVAGVAHFVAPRPFRSIVPRALGDPAPWVAVSGAAELAVAAGLTVPRTRRAAGYAAAGLFAAVYPANVQMAVTALRSSRTTTAYRALSLARLPLQAPLITRSLGIARAAAAERA